MNADLLLHWIGHFGYTALFFALWLGIVGMPIPDEVIVMTGGAVSGMNILLPLPAFVLTYLGVVSGLSVGFMIGRGIGVPILERLRRRSRLERYLEVSESLMRKYGSLAICLSYFLPVVRHIVPYLVGVNRMTYKRYALYAYSAGFVWTLLFFSMGRALGSRVEAIGELLYRYGLYAAALIIIAGGAYWVVRQSRNKRLSEPGG
ncbi:DedA family protein [Paenibacillus melissococcoides]|uniref:DedA family protein n=1 Tax=Paenibacillus melissococcoides TaxID=2912268 RepID=A0ABM9G409_9BACL|nr:MULTISPECIES: DedA family protein [Paenibacillus]MEB9894442.1 DedA family protein [Bacillus cereus]CAH8246505.1 DedA family protein [Paenibacillus melissococcoides]CAH8714947.1 DedA family protein [Paenibacillus melissococcoides]CAH8715901.1 DedA family protein [Paenibacillus melissococcoides]GIO79139.1 alkaline phosphatase [Paenibacillus dendritiformis]